MMVDNISDRTVGDSREQATITRPRFKHIFCLCRSCIDWPSGRACSGFRSDRMERWSGGLLKSSPLASHPNRCDTQLCWIWYGKKGQLAHSAVVSSDSGSPPNPKVTASTCAMRPHPCLTLGCHQLPKMGSFSDPVCQGHLPSPVNSCSCNSQPVSPSWHCGLGQQVFKLACP